MVGSGLRLGFKQLDQDLLAKKRAQTRECLRLRFKQRDEKIDQSHDNANLASLGRKEKLAVGGGSCWRNKIKVFRLLESRIEQKNPFPRPKLSGVPVAFNEKDQTIGPDLFGKPLAPFLDKRDFHLCLDAPETPPQHAGFSRHRGFPASVVSLELFFLDQGKKAIRQEPGAVLRFLGAVEKVAEVPVERRLPTEFLDFSFPCFQDLDFGFLAPREKTGSLRMKIMDRIAKAREPEKGSFLGGAASIPV